MVNVPPQFHEAYNFVAGIFAIDPTWLVWPNILTIFIVPLIFNIFAMYFILERLIRIFPGSGINYPISGIIGFLMLPYNWVTMFVTPAMIGFLGPRSPIMKIVLTVILYLIMFLIIPFLANLSVTGV